MSLRIVLAILLATCPALAASHDDDGACETVDQCLATASDPRITTQEGDVAAWWLEDHADDEVVARMVSLLTSDSEKLRQRAATFLRDRTWPGAVADLVAAREKSPRAAMYLLAGLDTSEAFDALAEIALDPAVEPDWLSYAFSQMPRQEQRVIALGMDMVECRADCPWPARERLVDGIFQVRELDAAALKRLETLFHSPDAPDENRVLAFRAAATQFGEPAAEQLVQGAYEEGSALLRKAIAERYPGKYAPERPSESERLSELRAKLRVDPLEALERICAADTDLAQLADELAALTASRDPLVRHFAVRALWCSDRNAWRERMAEFAADRDLAVVGVLIELAGADGVASLEATKRSLQGYWYPPVAEAATRTRVVTSKDVPASWAPVAETGVAESPFMRVDMGFAKPFPDACADSGPPATVADLPSLLDGADTVARAAAEADVSSWNIESATPILDGWILGGTERGGQLYYAPNGKPSRQFLDSPSGVRILFTWRGAPYAVIGASKSNVALQRAGPWAELVRLEPVKTEHPYSVIAHLPARVLGVYGDDTRLLLFAARSGVFDLTNPSDPRWLGCAP